MLPSTKEKDLLVGEKRAIVLLLLCILMSKADMRSLIGFQLNKEWPCGDGGSGESLYTFHKWERHFFYPTSLRGIVTEACFWIL